MDYGTAIRVLLQAHKLEVPALKFNYRGEPTIHPRFKDILLFAKDLANGYTFQERIINTNMQFDSDREDIFEGLLAANKIKISIDTFNIELYNKLRKGPACNYKRLINNINKLYNHPKREPGHKIILQFVRGEENKEENFKKKANFLWPGIDISIRELVGGRSSKYKKPKGERKSCIQAFARLMVLHDGKLQVCCPNYKEHPALIVGHIDDLWGIKGAFNSPKAKIARKNLKNKKAFLTEPCKSCSSYESFKGWKQNKHA